MGLPSEDLDVNNLVRSRKILVNLAAILGIGTLYYYLAASFGPLTFSATIGFSIIEVKVLAGTALVVAVSAFYDPIRGLICIILGESLVQVKLGNPPVWGFLVVHACFFLPLFFFHIDQNAIQLRKNAFKFVGIAFLGTATALSGYVIVGLVYSIPFAILIPNLFIFCISGLISFVPSQWRWVLYFHGFVHRATCMQLC